MGNARVRQHFLLQVIHRHRYRIPRYRTHHEWQPCVSSVEESLDLIFVSMEIKVMLDATSSPSWTRFPLLVETNKKNYTIDNGQGHNVWRHTSCFGRDRVSLSMLSCFCIGPGCWRADCRYWFVSYDGLSIGEMKRLTLQQSLARLWIRNYATINVWNNHGICNSTYQVLGFELWLCSSRDNERYRRMNETYREWSWKTLRGETLLVNAEVRNINVPGSGPAEGSKSAKSRLLWKGRYIQSSFSPGEKGESNNAHKRRSVMRTVVLWHTAA